MISTCSSPYSDTIIMICITPTYPISSIKSLSSPCKLNTCTFKNPSAMYQYLKAKIVTNQPSILQDMTDITISSCISARFSVLMAVFFIFKGGGSLKSATFIFISLRLTVANNLLSITVLCSCIFYIFLFSKMVELK